MLDQFFKFKVGDFVQPVGFGRKMNSQSVFEMRYRVALRYLIEGAGFPAPRVQYELRGINHDGNMQPNLFQVGESELMAAEPWSECG